MVKLRKQRRKKTYNFAVNRKRLRNRLNKQGTIQCKEIKEAWETGKSVKRNLLEMGLAYNPNKTIKINTYKKELASKISNISNDWQEEIFNNEHESRITAKKGDVLEKLVADARAPRRRMFRLPKSQVEWCSYLLDKYGMDYKAMARDNKNYNQETWKQIRAKIRVFMNVPEQFSVYLEKTGKTVEDFIEGDCDSD